jgi:hypothetical protein
MTTRRKRDDETRERLLNWSDAQKASERLAGHVLASEGFTSINPSHPLGGPDGLKDILCKKGQILWVAACYFPNGKKTFRQIYEKFVHDAETLKTEKRIKGFIFVTNQNLSLSQREQLKSMVTSKNVEVFHLERLTHILNRPENYGTRLEFLDIEMNKEEQISYFATTAKQSLAEFQKIQSGFDKVLKKMQEWSRQQGDKK